MEKILLAMDAKNINTQTINFACYLARLTNSRLIGIFLEDLLSEELPVLRDYEQTAHGQETAAATIEAGAPKTRTTEENIRLFKLACECRSTVANIHRDRGIPLEEIIEESRFADLLVVDAATSFTRKRGPLPGKFVKDVLQEAECPVIIAPYSFNSIDEIIFAYNDSASSVFAIKQFTYLFPEWKKKKVLVVNVRDREDKAIEDQFRMKEWLRQHYTDVELKVLTGDSSDQLFGYLIDRKNALVVIGAYGRGMLSNLFRPSHAHLIVKTVNLPIFITHH
jgi:nucleotide-binding universal stress UspA family protein